MIYDATPEDYKNILCFIYEEHKSIESTITKIGSYSCSSNSTSNLNYPSFIDCHYNNTTSRNQTFQRIVTNVGQDTNTYKANITRPNVTEIYVSPSKMVFNEKKPYKLTIKYIGNNKAEVLFGWLVWVEEEGITL